MDGSKATRPDEKLEGFAYEHDFNRNVIRPFNVFDHGSFLEDCKKNAKKNAKDYEAFCERLRRDLMYWFWSKCEWEIIISPWVSKVVDCSIKVDVYDQVMMNWKQFCDYTWSHAVILRRREKNGRNNKG